MSAKRSEISRRDFLATMIAGAAFVSPGTARASTEPSSAVTNLGPHVFSSGSRSRSLIDRKALVFRHSPSIHELDPLSPLSVGNGEFAFTADITGLQTFPTEYENKMPLCTMSQWGWHNAPPPGGLDPNGFRLTQYDTHGRSVGYLTSSEGQAELYDWLRENPHRLHLGRIGLLLKGENQAEAQSQDLSDVDQRLDLWSGILRSRFRFKGEAVSVRSAVHPKFDLLAVAIESPLIARGLLAVRLAFPYGSHDMQAANWKQPGRHESAIVAQTKSYVRLQRRLDADQYYVEVAWDDEASFVLEKPHFFLLNPKSGSSSQTSLDFVVAFSPVPFKEAMPDASATFSASSEHWQQFWTHGGAIELASSRDPRAQELERRVVLSQYLTAIQCAGSIPPQETGLTVNSWYGKFHLEMHWWHAAHFALWNRLPLLEKSLKWYESILPAAIALAQSQGYAGARWPKMVGPEGRNSPSPIGSLLIWQQPHPIFYAELCYLTNPNRATLERYRDIVFESAEFMSSYAYFELKRQRYVLGPPVIPAQENHPPLETWNPTFELAYWVDGLTKAQRWCERLGMKRNSVWDTVIAKISALPVRDGVYLAHENCPQTYSERNYDHPSMLGAFGMLGGDRVDRDTMRRTLSKVMKQWQWDKTWGWDYPLTAMSAARLGERKVAVDALMLTTEKNRYLPNGHNWQRQNLPCYLPGNGGLLYAIAMMAAGWRGAPRQHAPGFPVDGSWTVRWETLDSALLAQL